MEVSSSKTTDVEELELEDLWSELHALKKLYGLLQKNTLKIPNGSHDDCLDEKSRNVLKKLLDDATHQALQSQAKIVCYTSKPTTDQNRLPETSISVEKEPSSPDELPKCHPVPAEQCKAETAQSCQPRKEPEGECGQVEEPKVQRKSSKIPTINEGELTRQNSRISSKILTINKGELTRQNSRKSIAISDKRLTHHHHHPHIHHRERESSKQRARNNTDKQKKQAVVNVPDPNEQIQPRLSNGELLVIVPAEKRARVEPSRQLGQFPMNQTRIVGRVDRELTHSKRGDIKARPTQKSRPPSRLGSLKDRGVDSIALKDQNQNQFVKIGKENPRNPPRQIRDQIAQHPKKHPPVIPTTRRMRSIACSSSNQTMSSDSSASSSFSSQHPVRRRRRRRVGPTAKINRRERPPLQMASRCKNVGLPNKAEGRLKRFRNKLAVIFHHHHHHHHHLHDEEHVDVSEHGGPRHHHRSPWAYLKSMGGARNVVHHTSGEGNKLAKAPARAPARQQHGYIYVMLERLIQHVWGMRRRKKKIPSRIQRGKGKKLHWWKRFRMRGGFRLLTSKKTPRLRLGLTKSHSRNMRNK